jgi:hypothetical protein
LKGDTAKERNRLELSRSESLIAAELSICNRS